MEGNTFDVLVIGAGTAGIPCAVQAARGGARVLLVDKADRIGGSLHVSGGHLTAGGTRRQRALGIDDDPDRHYDDVMRIGRGEAEPAVLRRAVDLAPGLVDWLEDLGFQHAPGTPRIVHGHEPYETARTHHGVDEARPILELLRPLLEEQIASGAVTLWLDTPVVRLLVDEARVVGAVVARGGSQVEVHAGAVVLATGGYAANHDLFRELEGLPLHASAPPTSTGDGIMLAREIGAAIVGTGQYIPTFGGLTDPDRPGATLWLPRLHLTATERDPWEIYVGSDGRRFVAEDEPSIDAKERRLLEHDRDLVFHVVIDDRGLREGDPLMVGTDDPDLIDRWANERDGIVRASTLEDLAEAAGIDRDGLLATVADYNAAIADGRDDPLGRTTRPAPIAKSPFTALRNHGSTVITFGGVHVDDQFRALRQDGIVIEGLYAIGEVIGAAATMGLAFCGGMTLTPALAFGRDLGKRLGSSS